MGELPTNGDLVARSLKLFLGGNCPVKWPLSHSTQTFFGAGRIKNGSKIMSYNHVFKVKVKSADLEKVRVSKPY